MVESGAGRPLPRADDAMSLKQEDAPTRREPDAPEPRRDALGCAWLACMRLPTAVLVVWARPSPLRQLPGSD